MSPKSGTVTSHSPGEDPLCECWEEQKAKGKSTYLKRCRDADNRQVLLSNPLGCREKRKKKIRQKPRFVHCRREKKNPRHTNFHFKKSQFRAAPLNHCNYLLGLQITQSRSKRKQVHPAQTEAQFLQSEMFKHPPWLSPRHHEPLTFVSPAAEEPRQQIVTWEMSPAPLSHSIRQVFAVFLVNRELQQLSERFSGSLPWGHHIHLLQNI